MALTLPLLYYLLAHLFVALFVWVWHILPTVTALALGLMMYAWRVPL